MKRHFLDPLLEPSKVPNCGSHAGKMLYTRARELVHSALNGIGLDSTIYGVHSLRAGGATAAVCTGILDCAFKSIERLH